MRYSCQVDIDVPREQVIALMTDGDRAHEWMPGLREYRATRGERGQEGSASELVLDGMPGAPEGGATMVEQVIRRDDAHYDLVYLVGPVRNEVRNSFTDTATGGTTWLAEHVFHLPPMMEQQMGEQGRAAFVANTQGSMETFKAWCEQAARA